MLVDRDLTLATFSRLGRQKNDDGRRISYAAFGVNPHSYQSSH